MIKTSGLVSELISRLGDDDLAYMLDSNGFNGLLNMIESAETSDDISLLEEVNKRLLMITLEMMDFIGSSDMDIVIETKKFEDTLKELFDMDVDDAKRREVTYMLLILLLAKFRLDIDLRIGCLKMLAIKTTEKEAMLM